MYENLPPEMIQKIASKIISTYDFVAFSGINRATRAACQEISFLKRLINIHLPDVGIPSAIETHEAALFNHYIRGRFLKERNDFRKLCPVRDQELNTLLMNLSSATGWMGPQIPETLTRHLKTIHEKLQNKKLVSQILLDKIFKKELGTIEFLIKHFGSGLNMNIVLIACARTGDIFLLEFCLAHPKVDPSYQDFLKQNALFHLIQNNHQEGLDLLLGDGRFDLKQRDPLGRTAALYAQATFPGGPMSALLSASPQNNHSAIEYDKPQPRHPNGKNPAIFPEIHGPSPETLSALQHVVNHLSGQLQGNSTLNKARLCLEHLMHLLPHMNQEDYKKVQFELTQCQEIINILKQPATTSASLFMLSHTMPTHTPLKFHSIIMQLENFLDQYKTIYHNNALDYAFENKHKTQSTFQLMLLLLPWALKHFEEKLSKNDTHAQVAVKEYQALVASHDKKDVLPILPAITYVQLIQEAKRINVLKDFIQVHAAPSRYRLDQLYSWLLYQSIHFPQSFKHEAKKTQNLSPVRC